MPKTYTSVILEAKMHKIAESRGFTKFMVWKFQDISVIQILREINFGQFRSSYTDGFAIFGALNFVNLVNFILQKAQNFIKIKIQIL